MYSEDIDDIANRLDSLVERLTEDLQKKSPRPGQKVDKMWRNFLIVRRLFESGSAILRKMDE